MGSWGVGDAIEQENTGLALFRGATLGIGILTLVKGSPPGRTPKITGDLGEARVAQWLIRNQYKDVLVLRNASGHGLDIVATTPDGRLAFFEVKTASGGAKIGDLSDLQRNMDDYVKGILTEAARGRLRGQTISAQDQAVAIRLLGEYRADPLSVSGTVVGVDLDNNSVHPSPWPGRPRGY
jgi:hypothetical protein